MARLTVNFFSTSLKRTVTINVILPVDKAFSYDGKDRVVKPYKTLYLLHGLLGDCNDWIENAPLRRLAEDHDLAVVCPSGENAFYFDSKLIPNADYGEFIGEELVKMTRKMFPLSHKREDTFIAGLSMGGYGAMRNGLKYHKTFSRIGCFSGALHIFETDRRSSLNADTIFGDMEKAAKTDLNPRVCFMKMSKAYKGNEELYPKIYMSCGEDDDLLQASLSFRDFLLEQGADVTWHQSKGAHEWGVWREEIINLVDWLPLGEAEVGIGSGNVK